MIDPDETIQDFLQRAGRLQQGLRRHEFANLSEVQAHAPIPKGKALFDTLFVNEGVAEHQKEFGSIRLTDVKTVQSSNYAMAMLVMPGKDATAELYFDIAKVSPEAAQRCMDLYNETLRAVPEEPERTIRELSWQGARNLTVPPAKQYQDVVTRFLRCATEQPESVAISDESGSLTYAELAIRSRKIAGKLRNAGVRSGDLVPVAVSRGTDTVAAFLGVMLTGAAYVPIDLSHPRNRIAQILERVSPRHIITDCSDLTTLPIQNGRIVHIDGLPEPLPAEEIQLGPIAYVIFTSGSQGQPKGVQISHRALAYSTGVRDAVYGAPPSVFLLLSSFAFDSSVAGIYWTLTTRGTLIIAPKHIEQDPADFGRLVAENSVSHTLCLPSLLQAIIEAVPSQKLQCLGTVITAGEPLTHALVNLSKNALPNCRIFNEYGPTEATVWCTVYEATDSGGSGTVPIGSALPGLLADICDPDGVLLPNGEVGEICIAGPTLAEGYLNDPALTRQSFVEIGPSDMLAYHTGDLGVADEDGAITFLGRLDGQIKIRGHRVELGEIEAVAQEVLPGVEIASIVTEMAHRKTIVLCVQDTANEDVSKSLWEAFQRSLPDYCHPKQLLFLSAFPRLPNGKVDRRELKWSAVSAASERCAGAAPQSDIEMQVADIFGEVLGVSERSREMHFFDFGGDSLKTIAVYSKARDQGLCIEATDVFENPTVRELAAQIQKRAVNEPRDVSNGVLRQANQRGDKTAVFVLHGTSDIFDQLVLKLGDRHPVGMLYSHFLHSESPPFSVTIEDLAAEAMAALRRVRPHGPYTLCGYSAAVPAILEMAHQLGPGEVKEVLLFDPPYLVVASDSDWQSDPIASRHHRKMVNKVKKRIVRRSLRVPLLKLNTWLRPNNKRIKDKSVRWAYDFAVSRYRLRKHDQPVQVFLSDGNPCLEKGSAFDKTLLDRTVHELKMSHKDIVESKHGASEFVKHIVSHSK